MSQAHFDDAVTKAKGTSGDIPGLIQPSAGPEPTIMPARKAAKPVISEDERARGIVAKETIDETQGTGAAPKAKKEKQPTRVGTGATTARGYAEGARPATKPIAAQLSNHITAYKTLLNTAASIKTLSPEHRAAVDEARNHIANAERSHKLAHTEGKLGTNTMNRDVAHSHLQDAADHLSAAHEAVMASGVHKELAKHSLNGEVPSDEGVRNLVAGAYALPRVGAGGVAGAKKPYAKVKFAKADLPGATIDANLIDRAVAVGGEANAGVQKLIAGQGTKRDPMRRENTKNALNQINKGLVDKGITPLTKLPTGVGGMISGIDKTAPVNPKRRGSGKRIDTRFSSDANKIGRTPRFEG